MNNLKKFNTSIVNDVVQSHILGNVWLCEQNKFKKKPSKVKDMICGTLQRERVSLSLVKNCSKVENFDVEEIKN